MRNWGGADMAVACMSSIPRQVLGGGRVWAPTRSNATTMHDSLQRVLKLLQTIAPSRQNLANAFLDERKSLFEFCRAGRVIDTSSPDKFPWLALPSKIVQDAMPEQRSMCYSPVMMRAAQVLADYDDTSTPLPWLPKASFVSTLYSGVMVLSSLEY